MYANMLLSQIPSGELTSPGYIKAMPFSILFIDNALTTISSNLIANNVRTFDTKLTHLNITVKHICPTVEVLQTFAHRR